MQWIKKTSFGILFFCLVACTSNDAEVAGSTLETENSIALLATLPNGNPVENALVFLHKSDFLRTADTQVTENAPETNENGIFSLDTLSPGKYIAEVKTKQNDLELKGAISFEITNHLDSSVIFSVKVDEGAIFSGSVQTQQQNAWVMIRGLEYAVPVDSLGNYSFPSLPLGDFEFVLVHLDSNENYKVTASVQQCVGCNSPSIPIIDTTRVILPSDSIDKDSTLQDLTPSDSTIQKPDSTQVDTSKTDTVPHFMFENFESGTTEWYSSFSQYASGYLEHTTAGNSRDGYAAHFVCQNDSAYNWALMGKYLGGPVDMSDLDSVVFWARGSVNTYISFSFDIVNGTNPDITSVKSWAHIYLDSEWKKYTLTPSNLLKADSIGGNVGWENVKTGITNISIFGGTGGEFWIDDIEFFGYEKFAIKE